MVIDFACENRDRYNNLKKFKFIKDVRTSVLNKYPPIRKLEIGEKKKKLSHNIDKQLIRLI